MTYPTTSAEPVGSRHRPIELYLSIHDCPHVDPYEDERFDATEDLIDEWLARNCLMEPDWPFETPGLTWDERQVRRTLRFKNSQHTYAVVPLAGERHRAQVEYDLLHVDYCEASPIGTACLGCLEDKGIDPYDPDPPIEPGPCSRR